MSLPRHFVPRPGAAPQTPTNATAVHALDVLRLGARHLVDQEWIVTVDPLGTLRLVDGNQRSALPSRVQVSLSQHEIARGRPARVLNATEVWLFDLQVMEQRVETPGPNDPVFLYGTLHGPFPGAAATRIEGQLTVSRADVLQGLLLGASEPFILEGDEAMRCFHALLPAEGEAQVRSGEGLVLAYPLMPAELVVTDASNTLLVTELLYDLLAALQVDLRKEAHRHPLVDRVIPVPSRAALESRLRADGFQVKGDTAVRKKGTSSSNTSAGMGTMLGAVWGALTAEKMTLPPEGDVATLLEMARESLKALPGWPDARALAVMQRLQAGALTTSAPTPRRVVTPKAPVHRATSPAAAPIYREPSDWVKDFMHAHDRPGSAPKVTSSGAIGGAGPAWMADFSQGKETPAPKKPAPGKKDKPDWMKDFE